MSLSSCTNRSLAVSIDPSSDRRSFRRSLPTGGRFHAGAPRKTSRCRWPLPPHPRGLTSVPMMAENAKKLPTIDDLEVAGHRVLVRCDLNVPLEQRRITDDLRIRASVPTLKALIDGGARIAVCSHLGRPKGKVVDELRLAPVGERLAALLGKDVTAVRDVTGPDAQK